MASSVFVPDEEIPDDQLASIEAKLRDDIEWAVFHGPGFDAAGAALVNEDGVWVGPPSNDRCGVCAIGSYAVHRQPRTDAADYVAFAKTENVPTEWARRLYLEVMSSAVSSYTTLTQTSQLARRLVRWSRTCQSRKQQLDNPTATSMEIS